MIKLPLFQRLFGTAPAPTYPDQSYIVERVKPRSAGYTELWFVDRIGGSDHVNVPNDSGAEIGDEIIFKMNMPSSDAGATGPESYEVHIPRTGKVYRF